MRNRAWLSLWVCTAAVAGEPAKISDEVRGMTPVEIVLEVTQLAPCHAPYIEAQIQLDGDRGVLTFSGNNGVLLGRTTRSLSVREVRQVRETLVRVEALPDQRMPEVPDRLWGFARTATLTVTSSRQSVTLTSASPISSNELSRMVPDTEDIVPGDPPPPLSRARLLHQLVEQLTGKHVVRFYR